MRGAAILIAALLAACAGAPPRAVVAPPEPIGADLPAGSTAWSNASLASLFTRLMTGTEWGGQRPRLLRYETPVSAVLEGPGAPAYGPFLKRYFAYLRRHAGVDIALSDTRGNLHLRFVPGGELRALLPGAACTLVPGDRAWEAFREEPARLGGRTLEAQRRLVAMTVFLPADAAPHRIRACLLEEIAQALGPVNDLDALSDSIFNDDFAHVWPTRLDLLMLRVLYAPQLATGLAPAEGERRARAVLDRLNPLGRRAAPLPALTMAQGARWRGLTARITERGTPMPERLSLAREALALARVAAPRSARACRSESLLGRLLVRARPSAALPVLEAALGTCAAAHGPDDIRLVRLQLASARALLAEGRAGAALARAAPLEAPLAGHGLDASLATLYALRARAAGRLGRAEAAAAAGRRARAWGARAFGPDRVTPLDWY